jgi:hypothetical protein
LSHRFRPRYRGFAFAAIGLGIVLLLFGVLGTSDGRAAAVIFGAVGVVLGLSYLASPAWRLCVVTDDEGLRVVRGSELRFFVPWDEIQRLVFDGESLFVDGGSPQRSLMVPAGRTRASYRIEGAQLLIDEIRAKRPDAVVEQDDVREANRAES